MRGLECLCFGDMLGGLWASLGVALRGLSQGTDFVLFSWLLFWMLPTFRRMLFYSLIDGLPVVRVTAVVRAVMVGVPLDFCVVFITGTRSWAGGSWIFYFVYGYYSN